MTRNVSAEDYFPNVDWADGDVAKYYNGLARSQFIVDAYNTQITGKWEGPTRVIDVPLDGYTNDPLDDGGQC